MTPGKYFQSRISSFLGQWSPALLPAPPTPHPGFLIILYQLYFKKAFSFNIHAHYLFKYFDLYILSINHHLGALVLQGKMLFAMSPGLDGMPGSIWQKWRCRSWDLVYEKPWLPSWTSTGSHPLVQSVSLKSQFEERRPPSCEQPNGGSMKRGTEVLCRSLAKNWRC